jgi:hypothetical protein
MRVKGEIGSEHEFVPPRYLTQGSGEFPCRIEAEYGLVERGENSVSRRASPGLRGEDDGFREERGEKCLGIKAAEEADESRHARKIAAAQPEGKEARD